LLEYICADFTHVFMLNFDIDYSRRIYGLDLYRAIAILLVVNVHGRYMLKGTWFENFPWIALPDGVELFFVLSGFLIGGILLKLLEKEDYRLSVKSTLHFWKRRWFRTLPNYYLILIVNVLLVYFGIVSGRVDAISWKFIFFIQNFATPFSGFFWESWSLSIEEWFYVSLPILLILSGLLIPGRRSFLLIVIILIVLPLAYRIYISDMKVNYYLWDVIFRKMVITRLDTVIYGVFAAYVHRYFHDYWVRFKIHSFIAGLAIIFITLYISADPESFFKKTFYFSFISIGAMLLLPLAESIKDFNSSFGKAITHISLISYSMYLVNLGIVVAFINKNFPVQSPRDGSIKYMLYWFVVIVLSTLIYRFFEKPVMYLREKRLFSNFQNK